MVARRPGRRVSRDRRPDPVERRHAGSDRSSISQAWSACHVIRRGIPGRPASIRDRRPVRWLAQHFDHGRRRAARCAVRRVGRRQQPTSRRSRVLGFEDMLDDLVAVAPTAARALAELGRRAATSAKTPSSPRAAGLALGLGGGQCLAIRVRDDRRHAELGPAATADGSTTTASWPHGECSGRSGDHDVVALARVDEPLEGSTRSSRSTSGHSTAANVRWRRPPRSARDGRRGTTGEAPSMGRGPQLADEGRQSGHGHRARAHRRGPTRR